MSLSVVRARRREQLTLWPHEFEQRPVCHAACRNVTGDFFEALTKSLIKAPRLITDSRVDVCPDLRQASGRYVEVKAIGAGGCVMLYSARLAKYRALGEPLTVCLWKHRHRLRQHETLASLRDALARSVHQVCLVDFPRFDAWIREAPEVQLNSGNLGRGWGSASYSHGHRRRWLHLLRDLGGPLRYHAVSLSAHGRRARSVEVYGTCAP